MHSQSRTMRRCNGAGKSLGSKPYPGRPIATHKIAVPSPWLGALMDTGNFMEDPYDKLKMIAPKTAYAQAKTYYGGGEWYTLDLDYDRIAKILNDAGYTGYVSLEFEGKENPDIAVPRSIDLLRKTIGA